METLPEIGGRAPIAVDVTAGETYWWCACGRSQDQPWCDGSHKGTGITPMEFKVDQEKNYALCQCKRSGDNPWCDGSHSKL